MIKTSPYSMLVKGELTFYSVTDILKQGLQFISEQTWEETPIIDFSGVTSCDSAGLALVIAWMRAGGHKRIHFNNIPSQLMAIARASDLEPMLVAYQS